MFKKLSLTILSLALFSVCLSAQTSGNVFASKKSVNNYDGTYTINIDAFVTGERVFMSELTCDPVDVVLVLDVSGSMENPLSGTPTKTSYTLKYWSNAQSSLKENESLYYRSTTSDGKTYYYRIVKNGNAYYSREDKITDTSTQLYKGSRSRLEALQGAVEQFLITMKEMQDDYNELKDASKKIQHRVGIVTFSGGSTGPHHNTVLTDIADGLLETTAGTSTTVINNLISAVNGLTARGATNADEGMKLGKSQLEDAKSERPAARRLLVFFTDGYPTETTETFGYAVANEAIQNGYDVKQNLDASIYVVSVIHPNDIYAEQYMKYLSSDYPEAQGKKTTQGKYSTSALNNYGTSGDAWNNPKYYKEVPEEEEALRNVFTGIATDFVSGGASYDLSDETVTTDIVMSDFKISKDAGNLNENAIDVYVRPFTGITDGVRTWGAKKADSNIIAKVEDDEDGNHVITVTGFDFAKHWCGYERINGVKKLREGGQKVCIDISLLPNLDKTGGYVCTNGEDSGIYANDGSEESPYGTKIATFGESPKVFAPCDIIISREGLAKNESAFYTVTRYKEDGTQDTSFQIIVPVTANDGSGKGETIIKGDVTYLKNPNDPTSVGFYKYRVAEDISNWDWSYNPDTKVITQVLYDTVNEKVNTFEFSVSRKSGLNSDDKKNTYEEKNINNVFKKFEAKKNSSN